MYHMPFFITLHSTSKSIFSSCTYSTVLSLRVYIVMHANAILSLTHLVLIQQPQPSFHLSKPHCIRLTWSTRTKCSILTISYIINVYFSAFMSTLRRCWQLIWLLKVLHNLRSIIFLPQSNLFFDMQSSRLMVLRW